MWRPTMNASNMQDGRIKAPVRIGICLSRIGILLGVAAAVTCGRSCRKPGPHDVTLSELAPMLRMDVVCREFGGCIIDVNASTPEGSLLNCALSADHNMSPDQREAMVKLLLDRGANIENNRGPRIANTMSGGIATGNLQIIKLLLDRRARIDKDTLLDGAATGDPQVMNFLLDHAGTVSSGDVLGQAVFRCCSGHLNVSETGAAETVRMLLDRKAYFDMKRDHGRTALQAALEHGDSGIARLLVEYGADANATDDYGATALMIAARSGPIENVRLLLHAGATLEARKRPGWTALTAAANASMDDVISPEERCDIVALLLKQGAPVNEQDPDGRTALMAAASHDNLTIIQILLKHGADPNIRDRDRHTALAHTGSAETVRILLSAGARVAPTDKLHGVPDPASLRAAAEAGSLSRVRRLLAHGASVNEGESDQNVGLEGAPLTLASRNGHTAVVRLLLSHGAKVNRIVQRGNACRESPALIEAGNRGHRDIERILKQHGAANDAIPDPVPSNVGGHYGAG